MYTIDDKRAAVFAIQNFLHLISRHDEMLPCVIPDGIYGIETRNCVRAFQRMAGLDITGTVDSDTFNSIVAYYRQTVNQRAAFSLADLIPQTLEGGVISPGDESNLVTVIQSLLKTLEVIYIFDEIEINGIYDDATQAAIKEIQRINLLPQSGVIDKDTWNALVTEYMKYKDSDQ